DRFGYFLDGELLWAGYGMQIRDQPVQDGTGRPIAPAPGTPRGTRTVFYDLDKAGNRNGQYGLTEFDGDLVTPFPYTLDALNQYNPNAHGQAIGNGSEHEISSYQNVHYTYVNDTHLTGASRAATESPTYSCQFGYDVLGRRVKTAINDSL